MKNQIRSIQLVLEEHKAAFEKEYGEHLAMYEEVQAFFDQDLLELVNQAGRKKKKADREAFLSTFDPLHQRIRAFLRIMRQRATDEERDYYALEQDFRWNVESSFRIVMGWMKSKYLYKRNEFNPPATDEQLLAVQKHIDHPIPGPVIQFLKIANGMASDLLRFQGHMTFVSTEEMPRIHDVLKQFAREFPDKYISKEHLINPILPIAQNGAGGYWFLDLQGFPNFLMHEFDHESAWTVPVNSFFIELINEPHKLKRL